MPQQTSRGLQFQALLLLKCFPSMSEERLGHSDDGTTAWTCSDSLLPHPVHWLSTLSQHSWGPTLSLSWTDEGVGSDLPRERDRKNSTQLKGFLLTYPSLLPSPPQFCVVVNPYRDTQLCSVSLGEPHHLSDGFSDTSSSFFLLWLCWVKAE